MPIRRKTDHLDSNSGLALETVGFEVPMSADGTPLKGMGTLGDGAATLTGPSTVRAANTKRRTITFWNDGPDIARVGAPGVGVGSGIPLNAGGSLTLSESAEAAIGMILVGDISCAISWLEELGP